MSEAHYKKGDEFISSGRKYTILSEIKSDNYSEVYRIERQSDAQSFLLKLLIVEKMPESLKSGNKPRLIDYLNTSNISQQLSVFDWGNLGDGVYYMISRYFTKGLLSDRLRQGRLRFNTAVNLILDLAKTLASLQAYDPLQSKIRRMRHGDICPNNIMYDIDEKGDYKAYLIDIEHISFIADNYHDAIGNEGALDIDHRYCAPEVLSGKPMRNSDVFSLGVVFYECCLGEYPFAFDMSEYLEIQNKIGHDYNSEFIENLMNCTPYYLTCKNCDGAPGIIIKLLTRMLEPDPEERIEMESVITALNALRLVCKEFFIDLTDERSYNPKITVEFNKLLEEHKKIYSPGSSEEKGIFLEDIFDVNLTDENKAEEKKEEKKEENTGIINQELGYVSLVRLPDKNARGFKDVAGMEDLKETMKKKVLFFLKNPLLSAEYRINYPNGMLLYGPPGCGKTFFAEKFAEESGFSFGLIKASDLGSTWVHGTQGKINELFKEAKEKAPCVLCFDEFDAFAPDRSKLSNANISGEVNEFLSQLNNCGKHRIFIIATTNNPEGIDPAILRSGRIEHKIYIPAPDFEARKAVIKHGVLERPCVDNIDFDRLAELTEGYITSDLSLIVNDAAMSAAYSRSFITQELLETAISYYKPSVSEQVLKEHEEIRKRMESTDTQTQNRIGFK